MKCAHRGGPVVLVSAPIAYIFPTSYGYLCGALVAAGERPMMLFREGGVDALVSKIMDAHPLLVGFGSMYVELEVVSNIIDALDAAGRDFPIVVGGHMVSPTPEFAVWQTGADYGTIGEAEITLVELVRSLRTGIDPSWQPGLCVRREDGSVTSNGPGPIIESLRHLPEVPYELFPTEQWLNIGDWYAKNYPHQRLWRAGDRVINLHGSRGCMNACNFCLGEDTKILYGDMSWRRLGDVLVGDKLVGFDENSRGRSIHRQFRESTVQSVQRHTKMAYRITTTKRSLLATDNHGWLVYRSPGVSPKAWRSTSQLKVGSELAFVCEPTAYAETADYKVGYIAGMTLGDGAFNYDPSLRHVTKRSRNGRGFWWRVAVTDFEILERLKGYLGDLGVHLTIKDFYAGSEKHRPLKKLETCDRALLEKIYAIIHPQSTTSEFRRGWLAGFYDAEGCASDSIRIAQKDISVLQRVVEYAKELGFVFDIEEYERSTGSPTARLRGGLHDKLRFFSALQSAVPRKRSPWEYCSLMNAERVVSIEPAGEATVVDIQTSTATFVAEGLATHNCYHADRYRVRPLADVFAQAQELLRRFDANVLYFSDDTAISAPRRAEQLVEGMAHLDRPVNYSVTATFDSLARLDDHLLRELARTGCRIMGLGAESGSDRILQVICPGTISAEQMRHEWRRLREVGILGTATMQFGQYTETLEDTEQTIAFVRGAVEDDPEGQWTFTITTPFPGSPLYQMLLREGRICDIDDFHERYHYGSEGARDGWCRQVVNTSQMTDAEVLEAYHRAQLVYLETKSRMLGCSTAEVY